jgi:dienelactone hydrolase
MITERVKFVSQDISLDGRLSLPDSGLARAGILCVTGGGKEDCDRSYLGWQEFMSEEGLASLAFNARGIGNSEGAWRVDSPNYDSLHSPANSQASRSIDTISAYNFLMKSIEVTDEDSLGVIGGSMGGDIVVHVLDRIDPKAAVLRAPSSYPNEVHDLEYGPDWGATIRDLGDIAAANSSSNFNTIRGLKLPMMLIYSVGEEVIPESIQDLYRSSVASIGGIVLTLGDETTPHTYIGDRLNSERDSSLNAIVREQTYQASTQFFKDRLTQ